MLGSIREDSLSRKENVQLLRLRIGHTRLTQAYLLLGRPQPLCDHCDVPLTVIHLLEECPHLDGHRVHNDLVNINLEDLLSRGSASLGKVMQFLRDAGLFFQI